MGRAARRDGGDPRGPRRPRGRARRPRRGVPAEHPGDDRGVPGHGVARRGVVLGRAGVRRAQRGRPLRPDRAEGAAGDRRLPLRRQGLRPPRGGRGDRRGDRRAGRAARLPRRLGLGGRLPRRRRARVRAGAVRPPALGALLVGHDRPAEGDRAGAGRDPARAPQDDAPAPRLPRRRPGVLVHHHRLDDVELPRRRAADRRRDRALRRQPRRARPRPALGPRRAVRDDDVRDERELHRLVHEGRGRAGRGPRPLRAARRRLDRLAARAGGLRVGLRARGRGHLAVLDLGRDRRVHGVRRRLPGAAGLRGRAAGARARRGPARVRRGRPGR